ncbi:MAG: HD domain-containing phosphohydrolase [Acidobacteriota bacterium]
MPRPLRVLLVEDDEDDALLVIRELKRGDFDPSWQRVDNHQAMEEALKNGAWELIICDYNMPNFSAFEALKVLRESGYDVPFIVASGHLGEDIAVSTMKAGAQDFIVKNNLKRLIPAAERELKEVEERRARKRAELALRESEAKYRHFFESSKEMIYIARPEGQFIDVNPALVENSGYSREELLNMKVADLYDTSGIIELLDLFKRQGFVKDFLSMMRQKNGSYRTTLVNLVARCNEMNKIIEYHGTIHDITERKRAEEDLKRSLEQLQRSMEAVIHAMASTIERRDPYTAGHQERVARLASAIASAMGLPAEQVNGLKMAAAIHDIGKIYVPAEILSRPGRITELEFSLIKTHPTVGFEILRKIDFPWPIAKIVLQHHERLDGSGYPAGLRKEEILLESKILAVADVMEAMVSHRPYRPALPEEEAVKEIMTNKNRLYDPVVVDCCLSLWNDKHLDLWEKK